MVSHRELTRTIVSTGPELIAVLKVDRWVVRRGGDASSGWEFLHRRDARVTRMTAKRIYVARDDVFDRATGKQIIRRDLRIGRSYDVVLELVKLAEQHGGGEVFRTAAGKEVAGGS